MAVNCGNCGEELIGSVNRCWKCGRLVESRPGVSNLPPVRREAPVAVVASEPAKSESDSKTSGDGSESDSTAPLESEDSLNPIQAKLDPDQTEAGLPPKVRPLANRTVYHGSPFAPTQEAIAKTQHRTMAAAPNYPQNAAASGGAIASLCLGLMSLGIALIFWEAPVAGLVLSLLGLCMGIWGMYSNRRGFAALGLFFCIAAFGVSGFMGVIQLYVAIHGVSPFAAPNDVDYPMEPP